MLDKFKLRLKLVDITRNLGEIEEQHLILALQRRRMLAYPQISKDSGTYGSAYSHSKNGAYSRICSYQNDEGG